MTFTRLFVDSANLDEIQKAVGSRVCVGVTTNPTILAKAGSGDWLKHLRTIRDWMVENGFEGRPLHAEVLNNDPGTIRDQAERIRDRLNYHETIIKVPMRWDLMEDVYDLFKARIPVNITAVMSREQMVLARQTEAEYVSIFQGRIRDGGGILGNVLTREHGQSNTTQKIIVGSIRQTEDIIVAMRYNPDYITVPYPILASMAEHPQTEKVIGEFERSASLLQES